MSYFWSPDGKCILFFADASKGKGKKCELWSVPFEGGEPQNLGLALDIWPTTQSFHPDGRRLAFAFNQASFEVWKMENFLPVKAK